jgi:phage-related minor tail protein
MAGSIKGITIELDGNTSGLQKALSDVDKKSRDLQGELKQVEKALKFNPGNLDLLAQKQQLLAESVQATTTRLERLKTAQKQVESQFASGKIGADQFRAFQREIIKTESQLKGLKTQIGKIDDTAAVANLKTDMNKVEQEAEKATKSINELAEGLEDLEMFAGLAGDTLSKAFETALDSSSTNTKIDIAFDVPESSKKSVKDAIKQIEAYGVDGQTALEGVRRQWALNKNASDAANTAIVKGAAVIAAAYNGLDFNELIQETNEVAGALKISNQDALGLVNSLLKAGFPPEQVDIISEYGTQLKAAGFDAKQIQAIFAAGVDTKSWNIDNLIDGIKEGRIRMAEFGQAIPAAMQPLLQQAGISATQFQQWGKAIAQGGEGGKKALGEVAKAVQDVDNATLKNSLGVAIWGTQYEDQGANILTTLTNASTKTVDLKANQDQLNASVAQMNADPMVQLTKAVSDLKTAMTPVLEVIAQLVSAFAQWASANPVVAATITAIVAVIGLLLGIVGGLAPIFIALTAAAVFFGVSLGALTGVIAIVVASIAALIAAGVAIYTNWSTVSSFLIGVWEGIKAAAISAFNLLGTIIASAMAGIGTAILSTWSAIKSFFSSAISSIVSTVSSGFNAARSIVTSVISSIRSAIVSGFNAARSLVSSVIASIRSTISSGFNAARSIVSSVISNIRSTISSGFAAARSAVSGAVNSIRSLLSGLASSAFSWGSNLMSMFGSGIKSRIGAIVDAARSAAAQIKSYLGFASPTDKGPASNSDEWAPNFMSMFSDGIKKSLPDLSRVSILAASQLQAVVPNVSTVSTAAISASTLPPIQITFTGPITMDSDKRMAELGEKISQAIAKNTIIQNRAGGVRKYGQ